jgi:1-acyl-sn-glycerol-3-phosphate acyltransferase
MVPSTVTHPNRATPWLLYWGARLWFWIWGWDTEGEAPPVARGVLIAAPHTTNWDLPHMLAASLVFRYRIAWMGKDSLFRFPFGWFMRLLGGIPVDRSSPQGTVKSVASQLLAAEQLVVAIPPSGTRSKRAAWKSGFYWIAHEAQLPVICGYLDYSRKRAGLGFHFVPSGDVVADMDRVRAFYADKRGKYPENESPILLKEEHQAQLAEGPGGAG